MNVHVNILQGDLCFNKAACGAFSAGDFGRQTYVWRPNNWSLAMFWDQDFAFSNMVSSRHQTLIFHLFNKPRRLVVPNRKLALDIARGTLAILCNDGNSRVIQRIFTVSIST